jgi:type IV pilus assembly protein PilC
MATFSWTGKTREGAVQQGELVAGSPDEVISFLRKERIQVTSVQKKVEAAKAPMFQKKVGDKDVVVFTRQFATMIDAGLPLVQCLEITANQTENPTLAKALNGIRMDVEAGSNFADAIRKYPKIFDEFYVSMVAAGESGGVLDVILDRLSRYIEKGMNLKRKIKTATVYPSTIVAVAVIVISIMLVFVIPVFASMFSDFGASLPTLTQIVIDTSYWVKRQFLLIVVALGLFGYGFKKYYQTVSGRKNVDKMALRLPVFGDIIRKVSVAKFTRTLGTLISSGIPILEGLEIVAKASGNKTVEQALMNARQSISEGKTIAEPLSSDTVFPKMVVSMIAIGETTGALDTMLAKIADFYDDEVDTAVSAMTALLEPMLIVVLGIIVGTIVIAMYLPIFKLASVVT